MDFKVIFAILFILLAIILNILSWAKKRKALPKNRDKTESSRRQAEFDAAVKQAQAEAQRKNAAYRAELKQAELEEARKQAELEEARKQAELEEARKQAELEEAKKQAELEEARKQAEAMKQKITERVKIIADNAEKALIEKEKEEKAMAAELEKMKTDAENTAVGSSLPNEEYIQILRKRIIEGRITKIDNSYTYILTHITHEQAVKYCHCWPRGHGPDIDYGHIILDLTKRTLHIKAGFIGYGAYSQGARHLSENLTAEEFYNIAAEEPMGPVLRSFTSQDCWDALFDKNLKMVLYNLRAESLQAQQNGEKNRRRKMASVIPDDCYNRKPDMSIKMLGITKHLSNRVWELYVTAQNGRYSVYSSFSSKERPDVCFSKELTDAESVWVERQVHAALNNNSVRNSDDETMDLIFELSNGEIIFRESDESEKKYNDLMTTLKKTAEYGSIRESELEEEKKKAEAEEAKLEEYNAFINTAGKIPEEFHAVKNTILEAMREQTKGFDGNQGDLCMSLFLQIKDGCDFHSALEKIIRWKKNHLEYDTGYSWQVGDKLCTGNLPASATKEWEYGQQTMIRTKDKPDITETEISELKEADITLCRIIGKTSYYDWLDGVVYMYDYSEKPGMVDDAATYAYWSKEIAAEGDEAFNMLMNAETAGKLPEEFHTVKNIILEAMHEQAKGCNGNEGDICMSLFLQIKDGFDIHSALKKIIQWKKNHIEYDIGYSWEEDNKIETGMLSASNTDYRQQTMILTEYNPDITYHEIQELKELNITLCRLIGGTAYYDWLDHVVYMYDYSKVHDKFNDGAINAYWYKEVIAVGNAALNMLQEEIEKEHTVTDEHGFTVVKTLFDSEEFDPQDGKHHIKKVTIVRNSRKWCFLRIYEDVCEVTEHNCSGGGVGDYYYPISEPCIINEDTCNNWYNWKYYVHEHKDERKSFDDIEK